MSMRDDRVSMRDMLNHAQEALGFLADSSRKDLAEDRMLQLALTRLIEIVGEAAHRVSRDTQKQHSSIPWPQIIGMRNRLIHGYDVIDYDLLWDTVTHDLPPLIEALRRILEKA